MRAHVEHRRVGMELDPESYLRRSSVIDPPRGCRLPRSDGGPHGVRHLIHRRRAEMPGTFAAGFFTTVAWLLSAAAHRWQFAKRLAAPVVSITAEPPAPTCDC